MPRTLLSSGNDKYRKLRVLLVGTAKDNDKDMVDIARAMDMCPRSAYTYLKNPEKLSLSKLLALCRNMNIPIDELRECIRY